MQLYRGGSLFVQLHKTRWRTLFLCVISQPETPKIYVANNINVHDESRILRPSKFTPSLFQIRHYIRRNGETSILSHLGHYKLHRHRVTLRHTWETVRGYPLNVVSRDPKTSFRCKRRRRLTRVKLLVVDRTKTRYWYPVVLWYVGFTIDQMDRYFNPHVHCRPMAVYLYYILRLESVYTSTFFTYSLSLRKLWLRTM